MRRSRISKKESLALTALIVAGGNAAASAQDANASKPAATEAQKQGQGITNALPEVVVRGQRSNYKPEAPSSPTYTGPLRDVPQTGTVIPQAVIEEQNATTLRDVLRKVPGISMQAGEGGVPAGDNLSIRGFNARTDLFVDGFEMLGDTLVLYPATSLHQVKPVTRGARICSFFWIQSMVRDDGRRSILLDLDLGIQRIAQDHPNHPSAVQLSGVYHHSLRQWAEV